MIDNEKLDFYLMQLGHDDFVRGTEFLRQAVRIWDREGHPALTDLLYPEIARRYNTTNGKVERAIRNAVEISWERGNRRTFERMFGYSMESGQGRPTNSEYIAAIADAAFVHIKEAAS